MSQKPYHHGDLRAALLAAAEAELAEKGVEGFSLRSVAKRAGVSHAAPAHHFGDTGGLLTALAVEGFTRFQDTLDAREQGATDDRDRAVRAGLGYLEFALARPALFRLIFSSARPDYAAPELTAAASRAYDHLVGLIRALGGDETDVIALWATSHGIADLSAGHKMRTLQGKSLAEREAMIRSVLLRCLPAAAPEFSRIPDRSL
ncbi:TetR/AcrR family transcriptional regulator [Rhodobacter calidifons]|uniref:TetR/AcrR family transcriptional regulator n=1 Tax=Rhodobacter calidifons TaxID=2715277 RepID=A0ABX0GA68_9RHOB|nr:TetR/AcrR family transcriptional regulator [Rhodobacter calidifons]NHB78215.1 TetR/AcrR family transcriptional regulator [Rhodobacter calidifons]